MNEYQDKDFIDKEYDQKKYLQKNKNINIIFIGIIILGLGLIALMSDFIFVQAMELFSMRLIQIQCLLLFIGIFTGMCFILCRSLLVLKYIHILTEHDALSEGFRTRQKRIVSIAIGGSITLPFALINLIIFNIFNIFIIQSVYFLCLGLYFFFIYYLENKFWKIYYKANLPFRIEICQLTNIIVALYLIVFSVFLGYVVLTSNTSATLMILCLVSANVLNIPFYRKAIVLFKNNQSTTPQ